MTRPSVDELSDIAMLDVCGDYIEINPGFYESHEWRNTRAAILEEQPICEICKTSRRRSRDVHHILPLSKGGEPFDKQNLIALCASCHRSIHGGMGLKFGLLGSLTISVFGMLRADGESRAILCDWNIADGELVSLREQKGFRVDVFNREGKLIGHVDNRRFSYELGCVSKEGGVFTFTYVGKRLWYSDDVYIRIMSTKPL